MKFIVFFMAAAAAWLPLCLFAQVDPASPADMGPKGSRLVFSDEFGGDTLDSSKWNVGVNLGNIHYENGEECVYAADNVMLRDGKMVIAARVEPGGIAGRLADGNVSREFSSGAVNTENTFYLKQNMYVELRIKLPLNDGGYGAFWSMPHHGASRIADPSQLVQVNFFEYIAAEHKRKFWSTLWFNDYLDSELHAGLEEGLDYFHVGRNHNIIVNQERKGGWTGDTFNLPMFEWYEWFEWTDFVTVGFMAAPEKFQWFVVQDGPAWKTAPYLTFSGSTVKSAVQDHWEKKCYAKDDVWQRGVPPQLENRLILSYALRNAEWAGGPINKTQLPSEMVVDYIRVYELAPRIKKEIKHAD